MLAYILANSLAGFTLAADNFIDKRSFKFWVHHQIVEKS